MRISCPAVVCDSALCASSTQFVLAAPELDALHAKQFQPVVCYIAPPPRHASGITLSMPVGYCATARGVLLRPRARIHAQKPRAKDGAMNCKVFTRKRRVGRRPALEAANSATSAPAERRGTFGARHLHRAALLAHNPPRAQRWGQSFRGWDRPPQAVNKAPIQNINQMYAGLWYIRSAKRLPAAIGLSYVAGLRHMQGHCAGSSEQPCELLARGAWATKEKKHSSKQRTGRFPSKGRAAAVRGSPS